MKAKKYLDDLCDANERAEPTKPPVLNVVFNHIMSTVDDLQLVRLPLDLTAPTPRAVKAIEPTTAEAARRAKRRLPDNGPEEGADTADRVPPVKRGRPAAAVLRRPAAVLRRPAAPPPAAGGADASGGTPDVPFKSYTGFSHT